MITMKVERQYIDVFQGSIYCTHKGEEKKLVEFVFIHKSDWQYKNKSFPLDGKYKLKYDHFGEDGYQFRPVVNHHGLKIYYQDTKNPRNMIKNVIYLLINKPKWEDMCRFLFMHDERECVIEGYNSRRKMKMIPNVLIQYEDEDEKFLEDWEEED